MQQSHVHILIGSTSMKTFGIIQYIGCSVDRNRVTRATYCLVHVMCVLPRSSAAPTDTNSMTGAVRRVRCKVNKQAP